MDDTQPLSYVDQIKLILADQLGLDASDISEEDSFMTDLHMRPTDFADFLQELEALNFDTENVDLSTVETVGELAESLSSHIYTS